MSLKTKQMLKIFQPIEKQVKKLLETSENDNVANDSKLSTIKKSFIDQLNVLALKFASISKENYENYEEMKLGITSIIEKYCALNFNAADTSNENLSGDLVVKSLVESFLKSLKDLEALQIMPLKQTIEVCYQYVTDMSNASEIEDLQNVKELGTSILEVIESLQEYRKNIVSNLLVEKLALYCCQLSNSCVLLIKVIQNQHQIKAPIYTCKKYACERICSCFNAILIALTMPNPSEGDEYFEKENNFISKIDSVLDILSSMVSKNRDHQLKDSIELWMGIEDVFSHAMSIAQVCQPDKFKDISGSCHAIMTEYENLKKQLDSDPQNIAMNNLYLNSVTDGLYRLERKINISVLSIVMEVFSDPYCALKKLINCCGSSLNKDVRSKADLNSAIEVFDQLSDKSAQIGKFAISCCRNSTRMIRIKNCLASFESLEMELIPAIISFYLHPDNNEMKTSVKLLTSQWQNEMSVFRNAIDLIIDPSSYCQVVLDDLQEKINNLSEFLDNRQEITSSQVQTIVLRALTLYNQINTTISDIDLKNIDRQTGMMLKEYKAAIYEVDAASKKFLHRKDATSAEQLRVINRCEIMLKLIKKLQPALSSVINKSIISDISRSNSIVEQEKTSNDGALNLTPNTCNPLPDKKSSIYIKSPYSVKNCSPPVTVTIQSTKPCVKTESDFSVLVPYIQKGRALRNEWSVMYKTPKRPESEKILQNKLKPRNLSAIRQHLFSRDSFLEDTAIDVTVGSIDLTNILENLTDLSDTLNSLNEKSLPPNKKSHLKAASASKTYHKGFSKQSRTCQFPHQFPKKINMSFLTGSGDAATSSLTKSPRIVRNEADITTKL